MRKTDKKRDNTIRQALTVACEHALETVEGFQWLTHKVDFQQFPKSLVVICVFDTDARLKDIQARTTLQALIMAELNEAGISMLQPDKQLLWDSEQACEREHDGNWNRRLSGH